MGSRCNRRRLRSRCSPTSRRRVAGSTSEPSLSREVTDSSPLLLDELRFLGSGHRNLRAEGLGGCSADGT